MNSAGYFHQNNSSVWTPVRKQTLTYNDTNKVWWTNFFADTPVITFTLSMEL